MPRLYVVFLTVGALGTSVRSSSAQLVPTHVLSNEYHAVHDQAALTDAAGTRRKDAFDVAFDGIIDRGSTGQRNGFDTWEPLHNRGNNRRDKPGGSLDAQ